MNDLDSYTAGSSGPSALTATGGARKAPLPYPFGHIGALTNSSSKQLAMKAQDFRAAHKGDTLSVTEQWNALVQAGKVTFTVAAESTTRDVEEKYITAV